MQYKFVKALSVMFSLLIMSPNMLFAESFDEQNNKLQEKIDENMKEVDNNQAIRYMILDSIFRDCEEAIYHANNTIAYKDYERNVLAGLNAAKLEVKRKYEREVSEGRLSQESAQSLMAMEQGRKDKEYKDMKHNIAAKLEYKLGRLELIVDRVRDNIRHPPGLEQSSFTEDDVFKKRKTRFMSSKPVEAYRKNVETGKIPKRIEGQIVEIFKWVNYSPGLTDSPVIDPSIVKRL